MIACLGEALVDLICERRGASFAEADSFTPHFGGALANIAVASRRAGAETALAGGAGDDQWGRWLRERLAAEEVDLRFFELAEGARTPVAFAVVDGGGEPSFEIYGESIVDALDPVEPRLGELTEMSEALVFGSTTLAEDGERRITEAAHELALERGLRVCFDPNIRPNRWHGEVERALEASRDKVKGAYLVRSNRGEALALTGAEDPAEAAEQLVALGAELAVVTLGEGGALVRGACEAEAPSPEVEVVSTLGAGDAFMGTFVAGLARVGWDSSRAGELLEPALTAAAEACTRWSALG